MAKFTAEYKVNGEKLALHVKNKQLESTEIRAFLEKAISDATVMDEVEFITLRRIPEAKPKVGTPVKVVSK
jgi:hypothetical protein